MASQGRGGNVLALVALIALVPGQATGSDADTPSLLRLERAWNDAHLEVIVPKMPPMTKAQVLGFAAVVTAGCSARGP
jgi:hypothetical protein